MASPVDKNPLDKRRAEFELLFWVARQVLQTVREALVVVLAAAVVVYLIVALAEGHFPLPTELLQAIVDK